MSQTEKIKETNTEETEEVQTCRVCGCKWDCACPGGCYWVEYDLCSQCTDKI